MEKIPYQCKKPFKCSLCDRVFMSPYGEDTISMQNKYILENYYTHKSVGLNHLNAVNVTEFTHILASFWKNLKYVS